MGKWQNGGIILNFSSMLFTFTDSVIIVQGQLQLGAEVSMSLQAWKVRREWARLQHFH